MLRVAAPPLRIELPVDLPLRSANAWLFPGDSPVLVDSGAGTDEAYTLLRRALWDSGANLNSLRLVVTHGHVDHAGNAARLRREFGTPLWCPQVEAPFVETFRRDAPRRLEAFSRALVSHGVPPDALERSRDRGRHLDTWMEDVPIGRALADGDRIVLGGTEARVRFTPGHTPGSLCIATEDNLVLTGDTLLEHITSNAVEILDRDRGRYHQYVKTLDGLRRFVGCEALPGHHAAFRITDGLLDGHQEKHHRRSERILAALDRPKTAWQVLQEVLPHLAHGQEFLGMCEVVGHLRHLEAEGKAKESEDGGVRRFAKA